MQRLLTIALSLQLLLYSILPGGLLQPSDHMLPAASTESSTEAPSDDASFDAVGASLSAPSVVLMEASTGTILYEKDSHTRLHPASVTKIMTLLLIFEALEKGSIHLEDTVTVSEHAASMGGSQVFLEVGETQNVETMIKCISISSANDACVAMAEFISGSEEAFVAEMNQKAKALGMNDTTFVNCCGLDTDAHLTSAHDVALMSRELTVNHPDIHKYCTIWMDTITHVTAKGSKEFGLSNTNKLIRQYEYATGLKTGSTSLAKFCVSATAVKDDMELIAVIMGAADPNARFADASALLNFGFAKCKIYTDDNTDILPEAEITRGLKNSVPISYENKFQYINASGADFSQIEKKLSIPKQIEAPIKKGDKIGKAIYYLDQEKIGSVNILADETVQKAKFLDYFRISLVAYFS